MTKVFNKSLDVMHVFAQQTQEEGKSSNVFFYGKKLYSYGHHYLLAEFIDNNTVLINDKGYSVTTSKHISQIIGATSQYKQFFKTRTDLELVYNAIKENKKALINARKPEKYINNISYLFGGLNEFLDYKKDKTTRKDSRYKEIKAIFEAVNNFDDNFKQKLQEEEKKRVAAQKRREAKELKEKLIKFNEYEINSFRVGEEDYLRLSKDSNFVETSQGVRIQKENAKNLYLMIKNGIDIKGKQIENYTITSINGTLKIGCHNINIESVHTIGKLL